MENFKIRTNEFKKYLPVRKGLVIEFNGEGIIDIVPTTEEGSFILFDENGSVKNITDEIDFLFEVKENEEIKIEFQIGEGLRITTFNDEARYDKMYKSYFIPVKSSWVVEFRNRRACGKTTILGNKVFLHLERKKGN